LIARIKSEILRCARELRLGVANGLRLHAVVEPDFAHEGVVQRASTDDRSAQDRSREERRLSWRTEETRSETSGMKRRITRRGTGVVTGDCKLAAGKAGPVFLRRRSRFHRRQRRVFALRAIRPAARTGPRRQRQAVLFKRPRNVEIHRLGRGKSPMPANEVIAAGGAGVRRP
jgi:hypothetical protein